MFGYVAVRIVLIVFLGVNLIFYTTLGFSTMVVDMARGFADVKGLTCADVTIDNTG